MSYTFYNFRSQFSTLRPSALMPDPAHNTQLNKEFRLHMAAILYFLSRIAVVGFVFAIPALYFIRGQLEMPMLAGGAIFVIALLIGYYVAASTLRCSACSGPVLMDNGHRKHPHAQKLPGINHRSRVAWDILFSSSYQCMYCNTRCRCKKNWSGKAKPVVPVSYTHLTLPKIHSVYI